MNEKRQFDDLQRWNSTVLAKYRWTSSLIGMQRSSDEIHQRRHETNRKVKAFLRELMDKRIDLDVLDDQGILERYHKYLRSRSQFDDDADLLNEFHRRLRALQRPRPQPSLHRAHSIQTDLDESISSMVIKPIARRLDGDETVIITLSSSSSRSPNELLFNQCVFPRSLISRHRVKETRPPSSQSSSLEQFDPKEVFHFLDQLDSSCSPDQFTSMLTQLTLSTSSQISSDPPIETSDFSLSLSDDDDDDDEQDPVELLQANFFDQFSSTSVKYFSTHQIIVEYPQKISVYTMNIGTIQLTSSLTVPYSILVGHRPVLQRSINTSFKRIRSKRSTTTVQVTAIDSTMINVEHLRENDIIIKINDQSVCHWTTEKIRRFFQNAVQRRSTCSITIIRLCQPFSAEKF